MRPDCTYTPNVIADHEALLAAVLAEVPWTQQMASRRTASMGLPYNYAGARYPEATWHPAVQAVADQIADAVGFQATNCLLNDYPTGKHSLGWHADDVDILAPGTGIAIVSLGVARILRMRTTTEEGFVYVDQLMEPGSLLFMSAAMQADWKHSLRRAPTDDRRISLTFRQITHVPKPPEDKGPWRARPPGSSEAG
ncbi:MAG: alpha-ketoglutarate-dependent dioxygenase AlkB [Proteobacteria bacterium]|nr:alpha-ketoglutarate-dependent dioxygenase AlkB [Pseudomonadota bacterium]